MNWGNRILLVFVAFAGLISYMVYRCMETPVDLVSNQYYKDELAYQQVIDGTKRANALAGKVEMVQITEGISIRLPSEMRGRTLTGSVVFYCPSDGARDRSIVLAMDAGGRQVIGAGVVPAGKFTVRVSWQTGGVNYFMEEPFSVQ